MYRIKLWNHAPIVQDKETNQLSKESYTSETRASCHPAEVMSPHVDKGKLERKKPISQEDGECPGKKAYNNENDKKATLLYPPTHVGIAVVEVSIRKEFFKKSKNQNLMMIAKVINSVKLGATDIKSRSSCAALTHK